MSVVELTLKPADKASLGAQQRANKTATVEHNFTYHAPKAGHQEQYTALRAKAKELALLIVELTPASREQSVALTELESSIMWSNAAIARHGE